MSAVIQEQGQTINGDFMTSKRSQASHSSAANSIVLNGPPTPPSSFITGRLAGDHYSTSSSPIIPTYMKNNTNINNNSQWNSERYKGEKPTFSRALSDLGHEFSHYKPIVDVNGGDDKDCTNSQDSESEHTDEEDDELFETYNFRDLSIKSNSFAQSDVVTPPPSLFIMEQLKSLNIGPFDSFLGREQEAIKAMNLELDSHVIDRFRLRPILADPEKPCIPHEPVFENVEDLLYQLYPEIMKGTIEYMHHQSRLMRNRKKLCELNEAIQKHEQERIEFLDALAKQRYN